MDTDWRRRLLIVDDDPLMSRLLCDALSGLHFDVATVASMGEARAALREFDPDVAVVDLELANGPSGVDVAHLIHSEHPGVGIVILTRHPDLKSAGHASDALPPGTGFLRKDLVEDPRQIEAAIDAVVAERATDIPTARGNDDPLAVLTPAQREVLALMAQGYDNEAIAQTRGCSRSSVANRILDIYRRLGIEQGGPLNPRVEAVRRFTLAAGLPERGE